MTTLGKQQETTNDAKLPPFLFLQRIIIGFRFTTEFELK